MNLGTIVALLCFFMFLSTKLPDKDYSAHEQQLNKIFGHATINSLDYDLQPLKEVYYSPETYAPVEKEANKLFGQTAK